MSAYYAAPGAQAAVTGQEELAPVLVAFAGPAPQSRLTVLIRLLMVIPHLIVLWALAIAAYVVVIIGWFGALFTGRLPNFAADYLAGFVRWQTRVLGYAILLTDVYPPFTLEDADYPIRVAVRPGRLNRLAVLFRLILLIPAWIVEAVVGYGAFTLFQIVNWLIVLFSGRMPNSLYQALAAALRYQARVIGFAFMLTSAYPSGLYGDPVMAAPAGPAGPAGPSGPQPGYGTFGAQPAYGAPGSQPGYGDPQERPTQTPGDPQGWATQTPGAPQGWATQTPGAPQERPTQTPGDPQGWATPPGWTPPGWATPPGWTPPQPGYAQPGYAQPGHAQPGYGQQQPGYGTPTVAAGVASWWLVLSSGARKLMTTFIVLGVLLAAGVGLLQTALNNAVASAEAASQLQSDLAPLNSAINNYSAQVHNCQTTACASVPNTMAANAFNTFAAQVRAIPMPSGQASAEAANLAAAASHLASIFSALAAATTISQYNNLVPDRQQALDQVQQDYTTLIDDLTRS
jgi:hypothetical protein